MVRNPEGNIDYLGRIDNQVKIRGYRVELQEIEYVLKKTSGSEECVVLAGPPDAPVAEYLIAFLVAEDNEENRKKWMDACKQVLPDYMVPKEIVCCKAFPLNNNGKIDRKQLLKGYKEKAL